MIGATLRADCGNEPEADTGNQRTGIPGIDLLTLGQVPICLIHPPIGSIQNHLAHHIFDGIQAIVLLLPFHLGTAVTALPNFQILQVLPLIAAAGGASF